MVDTEDVQNDHQASRDNGTDRCEAGNSTDRRLTRHKRTEGGHVGSTLNKRVSGLGDFRRVGLQSVGRSWSVGTRGAERLNMLFVFTAHSWLCDCPSTIG
jgi:hypothetical protein